MVFSRLSRELLVVLVAFFLLEGLMYWLGLYLDLKGFKFEIVLNELEPFGRKFGVDFPKVLDAKNSIRDQQPSKSNSDHFVDSSGVVDPSLYQNHNYTHEFNIPE